MANIDFPTSPVTGTTYIFAGVTYTYTAQGVWSPSASISAQGIPQGRLTLQPDTPVMSNTSTGHTSIFYTPYIGNRVPIFDGVNMVMRTFTELTTTTLNDTENPDNIGVSKVNDWFIWFNTSSNSLKLCHGPDWTDDNNRSTGVGGTELLRVGGILLNKVAITNGPAAQRGTYVGSTKSSPFSQLDWQYGGDIIPGFHGVWNAYNRVAVTVENFDNTAAWSYGSQTYRARNAKTAEARISFIYGLKEDTISAVNCSYAISNANGMPAVIGIADNTPTNTIGGQIQGIVTGNLQSLLICNYTGYLFGFHSLIPVEAGYANNVVTFFGGQSSSQLARDFQRFVVGLRM